MPDGRLAIGWDDCGRADWDAYLAACGQSSLEQSWAYGTAIGRVGGRKVRRGVICRDGEPLAIVQAFALRRFLPLSLIQIQRGPLWLKDCGPDDRRAAFGAIRDRFCWRRRELLVWMPELPDAPDSERLMRACRCRRMVTGYSSLWLDLRQEAAVLRAGLHGKWRNALRRGESNGLRLRRGPGGGRLDWLLQRHEAFRRQAGFVGPPATLVRAIAADLAREELHVLCAYDGDAGSSAEPVAGILLIGHGRSATYYLGWTGDAGRRAQAHNLLLWRAIEALKETGTDWLDLGGIDARRAPGVARFKLGLGGAFFTLSGTYI